MTDSADRLLAAALGRAGAVFTEESALGELVHRSPDGGRTYLRSDSGGSTLTLVGGGRPTVAYVLVGVDAGCLR